MAQQIQPDGQQVLCLIPARQGSKSIKDKNIRPLLGKPLIAYSIEQSLASKRITRTVVDTDSAEYAEIAKSFGAEAPYLRPGEFAQDLSTDLEVFTHALAWFAKSEGYRPEICVHLRPTFPVRVVEDIDAVIDILLGDPEIDSVRSISPAAETPYKMWFQEPDGGIIPVVSGAPLEACSMPRQSLRPVYAQNAAIDAFRTRTITDLGSMTGRRVVGYMMKDNFDIDEENQFRRVEEHMESLAEDRSAHE